MAEWIPSGGDSKDRCGPTPGRVGDDELIAKFVSKSEWDSELGQLNESSLSKRRLCPDGAKFDDQCGDSEGLSVQRSSAWSNQDTTARLAKFFEKNPEVAQCVVMAVTRTLRGIRLQDKPADQVVFVFDDSGEPGGTDHAIIRIIKPRPPLDFIRSKIIEAFQPRP